MQIAIPIYDRFTALDAIGPYEVLSRVPGHTIIFVAAQAGPVTTDTGMLTIVAEAGLGEVERPDVVLVPGGPDEAVEGAKDALVPWLRAAHPHTTWTTSVCTGALLLGAAGILDGIEATTHWLSMDDLAGCGASPTGRRVVEQGKVITAAGVSSGIDMALTLVNRITGPEVAQAIQLGIEYDPEPPFDAGSPEKAPAPIVELVRAISSQTPA